MAKNYLYRYWLIFNIFFCSCEFNISNTDLETYLSFTQKLKLELDNMVNNLAIDEFSQSILSLSEAHAHINDVNETGIQIFSIFFVDVPSNSKHFLVNFFSFFLIFTNRNDLFRKIINIQLSLALSIRFVPSASACVPVCFQE